jgi:outer membrane protein TolC
MAPNGPFAYCYPMMVSMHGARVAIIVLFVFTSSLFIVAEEPSESQNIVTLIQCIEAAMQGGPDVKLADISLAMSRNQYDQTVAQNSLGVSSSGSVGRSQPLVNSTPSVPGNQAPVSSDSVKAGVAIDQAGGGGPTQVSASASYGLTEESTPLSSTKLSVSASQTLWDGGLPGWRAQASLQKAGIGLQTAQMTGDSTKKTIAYSVKQAYYQTLAQQRQIRVQQNTLAQRQEEQKKAQTLFQSQNATQIDLMQAEVNETAAELALRQAQNTLEVYREKLSNLVGWPTDRIYTVAEVPDMPAPSLDIAQSIKTALDQRSDLRQLQLQRATGDVNLSLTKAQGSPSVSASGGLSWSRDWTDPARDQVSYNLGIDVSVPIFDSGLAAQQLRQAQLQNESYDIQIAEKAAGIATDVKNAIYSLQDLLARADLAQKSLDLAKSQYELAKARYDSGALSMLDLLSASVSLTSAEVSLDKARSDAQLGVLALQNVMGN